MSSAFSVLFPRQICCPKFRPQPFALNLTNHRSLHVPPSRFDVHSLHQSPPFESPRITYPSTPKSGLLFLLKAAGVASIGLGATAFVRSPIYSDESASVPTPAPAPTPIPNDPQGLPPPPVSSVNLYELSFGTVCGVCAGIFVKKGAKALAFILGGVFVLLQYLGSASLIRVDWDGVGSRFENLFYRVDATGRRRAPSIISLWTWLVNFLTADFQPRASFIAGLALGLRIG